jgi:hypothetical protein
VPKFGNWVTISYLCGGDVCGMGEIYSHSTGPMHKHHRLICGIRSRLPSQVGPLKPAMHVQLSPLGPGEHEPPLRHIVERQCSSSGNTNYYI